MPLSLETLLAISVRHHRALLVLLISLVIYVFLTLRQGGQAFRPRVAELSKHRVKLVHIDTCRLTVSRIHERLDDCERDGAGPQRNAWPGPRRCCRSRGGHS